MRSITGLLALTLAWYCGSSALQAAEPGQAPGIIGTPAGTGPWPAVAEVRAELATHTIYHPRALPKGALPLYVWGNGACRDNGLAYGAYLRQVASHGYFIVSVGRARNERLPEPAAAATSPPPTPVPQPRNTPDETQPAQLLEAIEWAQRENTRAGGAFEGRIDTTRIAVGGHSCGGLQALAVSHDPRIRTTLVLNSGIYQQPGGRSGVAIEKAALRTLHGPMLYLTGGESDIAHGNSTDDVRRIDHVPVFFASRPVGHGGTFWSEPNGGDWARVTTRWLDWQLKGDADASWDFAGPACRLCTDSRWSVVQKNLPAPSGPLRTSRYVPVRDGTRLAVNVYRPAVDGVPVAARQPVLFALTPYRARRRDAEGRVVELDQFERFGLKPLLERGYVLAMADIRGKGASFGARRGFQDRTEALDGRDLVQWLASQPWSNGKVGMIGCSYLGGTTVHVASTAPPALRAIFTGATDLDKYAFVRKGGITAQFNTRPEEPLSDDLASVPVDEDPDGSLLQLAVAEHARNTPMAALWYGMPFRDSVSPLTGNRFWEEAGPYPYLAAIRDAGIAGFFWSNWQDEPTEQVILLAQNLDGRLLVGPGSHCVPPPGNVLGTEVAAFFDRQLKGERNAGEAPRVQYWLDGAAAGQEWIRGARLPGEGVKRTALYLLSGGLSGGSSGGASSGGLVDRTPPQAASASFAVDYSVGSEEYFDFWVQSQHGHGASFTGAPLSADMTLAGFPVLELTLAADRRDANVFAYLEDLAPDGTATVVAFGRLAASQRKLARAPYETLGLPWHSGLQADSEALVPGVAVSLRFALTPTARVLKAGHRLRVVITGADPRQRNLAELREDPPPRLTVGTGGPRPSKIELPLARTAPQR